MKNNVFGAIAVVAVILLLMYCSTSDEKVRTWKPYKIEVISWHKLDTFVFENPTFKVEYPDFFTVDTTELNEGRMSFRYVINGYFVVLRGFSSPRYELWDTNSVADSVESYLAELGNDTITMRDLHPGYFYLEGKSKKNEYKYYEQYVLGDEDIYIFELAYSPKLTDEQVKRLKELVHEWSPK